jgi:hypothetical protein
VDTEPLAATKTLAVDILSVTSDRQIILEVVKSFEIYGHVERGINPALFH